SATMDKPIVNPATRAISHPTTTVGSVHPAIRQIRGEVPVSAIMDKPIVDPATRVTDPMNTIVDSVPNVITQAIGMLMMEMMVTVSMAA
ncbi:MAG: hypothetical protein ACK2U1_23910, partial [Anaerolineales bacterium]